MTPTMKLRAAPCEVQLSTGIEDPEWDAFLMASPCGHYPQSSLWAQAKSRLGFRVARFVLKKESAIIAGAQILIRRVPVLGRVAYLPDGPVVPSGRLQLGRTLCERLRQFAKSERIRFVVVQPPPGGDDLAVALHNFGFTLPYYDLCPSGTLLIDLANDLGAIMAAMRKTTRYDIRAGERKGTVVREGGEGDLPVFYELHRRTGQRQGFKIYSETYFSNVWRIFAPGKHIKLFLAEVGGEPVSAFLVIAFGERATFWKNGWSGRRAECHPNEVAQWRAIQWAKSGGYRYYDFGGITPDCAQRLLRGEALPDTPWYRQFSYKIGFGGYPVLAPQASAFAGNRLLRCGYQTAWNSKGRLPLHRVAEAIRSSSPNSGHPRP